MDRVPPTATRADEDLAPVADTDAVGANETAGAADADTVTVGDGHDAVGAARTPDLRPPLDPIDLQRTQAAVAGRLFARQLAPPTVDRFVILGTAGQGAMGRVYRARDPALKREVALKMLTTEGPHDTSDARRARLLREARALARLTHPHVVQVFDAGVANDEVFVAMEYVTGGTLREWIAAGPHAVDAVLERLVDAGRGLAHAHAHGIVHRDFKPGNVLLDADGAAKVADFGLAKIGDTPTTHPGLELTSGTGSDAETKTGAVMGTPAYMAPEQRQGALSDARSDQYAFCVVLHEALLGARPDSVALGQSAAGRIPPAVLRVIRRGLRADPDQRFDDMDAVLAALDQARAPRSWRRMGVATALGGVTVLGVWAWPVAPESCGAGIEGLSGVWDREIRDEVQAALVAALPSHVPTTDRRTALGIGDTTTRGTTGSGPEASTTPLATAPGFAVAQGSRATEALDDYASAWTDARARACEARADPTQLYDLQMICLDERRQALGALAQVLVVADTEVAVRALQAVRDLPDLEHCSDRDALRRRVPLPRDPDVAVAVAAVDRALARVRSLHSAGRYGTALTEAEAALTEAEATHYSPVVARAQAILGDAFDGKGHYAQAQGAFQDAYDLAAAHEQEDLALEVAVRLIFIHADRLSQPEDGEHWGREAQAWLQRTGRQGQRVEASLHHNLAILAHHRADYAGARDHYGRALQLREQASDPDRLRIGQSLANLALVAQRQGHLDEALARQRQALEHYETVLGPDHPSVAELLVNLAGIQIDRGQVPLALEELERAARIQERVFGPMHPLLGVTLTTRAVAERAANHQDQAIVHGERALEIARVSLGPDHSDVAIALLNLGVFEDERGEHARAAARYEEAVVGMQAAFGPHHPHVAVALHNQGLALRSLGRSDEALALMREALAIRQRLTDGSQLDLAYSHDDIGATLVDRGEVDEGLVELWRAHALIVEEQSAPADALNSVLIHLGDAQLKRRDGTRALEHHTDALEAGVAAWGPDEPRLTWALQGIARAQLLIGRPKAAAEAAERALAVWAPSSPHPHHDLRAVWAQVLCSTARERARGLAIARELEADTPAVRQAHIDCGVVRP